MLPKWHILFGFLFAYIIYWVTSINIFEASLIFFSSFFIDFDHYLWYVFKKKDFNLKRSFKTIAKVSENYKKLSKNQKAKYQHAIFIFHGIEFWILLVLLYLLSSSIQSLSLISPLFLWVFLGMGFHMIIDYLELIYYKDVLYFKFSQIYTYLKNKNREKDFLSLIDFPKNITKIKL